MVECTGERFIPEVFGDWTLEHVHRYLLACELADGRQVLDIACGDGYGSHMLSRRAQSVIGVDIDAAAIDRARQKYTAENLFFRQGNATDIPLEDNAVDLVISFETIEHLHDHDAMMKEIRRVLRPDGVLFISSPDKYEYSDVPAYSNQFHVRELYFKEFDALLGRYFAKHTCFGQRLVFGSVIAPEMKNLFCSWQLEGECAPVPGLAHAVFHLGLASDKDIPELPGGLLRGQVERSDCVMMLKNAQEAHVAALEQQLKDMTEHVKELEKTCASFAGDLQQCRQELESAHTTLQSLLQSHSWRLTAPLRTLARALKGAGKIS